MWSDLWYCGVTSGTVVHVHLAVDKRLRHLLHFGAVADGGHVS